MTVTAAVSPLLLKRWLLKSLAMGAAAGEVYFAAIEAVLVFNVTVLAERRILLIPAAVKVAAIFENIASAVIKSALAVESATFLAFPFAAILARFILRFKTLFSAILAKAVATLAESAILAEAVCATFAKAFFAELEFARLP